MRIPSLIVVAFVIPYLTYAMNSVCAEKEKTLFFCTQKNKTFGICSTPTLKAKVGYIQYRATKNEKLEFEYPSTKTPMEKPFLYSLGAQGASVIFKNGDHTYTLYSDASPSSLITVEKGNKEIARIKCENQDNVDLSLTWVGDFFKTAGLREEN
jgi:hypothetical protein